MFELPILKLVYKEIKEGYICEQSVICLRIRCFIWIPIDLSTTLKWCSKLATGGGCHFWSLDKKWWKSTYCIVPHCLCLIEQSVNVLYARSQLCDCRVADRDAVRPKTLDTQQRPTAGQLFSIADCIKNTFEQTFASSHPVMTPKVL